MTRATDGRDHVPGGVPPEGVVVRPGVTYHPRSPDASPERLEQLAGIFKLTRPLTLRELHALIHDEEDGEEERERAGE
jgi:hypothetical protein